MERVWNYNYDYASCMVMKLGMAVPNKENPGKSKLQADILGNFGQACV